MSLQRISANLGLVVCLRLQGMRTTSQRDRGKQGILSMAISGFTEKLEVKKKASEKESKWKRKQVEKKGSCYELVWHGLLQDFRINQQLAGL